MNTTASPFELHALEKLREEELQEARAIQSVMPPAKSLRAGAVMISHEFQPVAAVDGDFLDYFELTDGSVGLHRGAVSGIRTTSGAVCGAGGGNMARRTQDGHLAARCACDFEPAADDSRHAPAVHGHPGCGFQRAQPRTANCQRGHARALSSLRQRLPQPEALRDPPGLFAAANYQTLILQLLAGDSALFSTDGIPDAFSRKEEQFGIERLQETCDAQQFASPTQLLGRVFAAVENFSRPREQQDDMAAALFHLCS